MKLTPYGISVRDIKNLDDAKEWTYRRTDGSFPPTPLIFQENPFSGVAAQANKILEIGCGCGRNVPWIMQHTYATYRGIDPNPQMLARFWEYITNPDWINRCAVGGGFPADMDYDMAISTFVLQHIGYRPKYPAVNASVIVQLLMDALRPGGVLMLFEHEEEEKWIEPLLKTRGIVPQVFIRNFGGFPELNDRGQVHHLILWQKP